jgi:hypothetical protein
MKKHGFAPILAIILAVIIIGGGAYLYKNTQKKTSSEVTTVNKAKLFLEQLQKDLGVTLELKNVSEIISFGLGDQRIFKTLPGFSTT